MANSYRYCRVAPTCAAQYVANKLAGAPVHSLPGGRTIVPLLHPTHHGLPFALTLELHAAQPAAAAVAAAPAPPPGLDRSVYALHYVLAGSGQLLRSGASEQLQAGDAVLMHSGAAACCAGAAEGSAGEDSASPGGSSSPAAADGWQLAELVAYMPQQLFEQQQQQAGEAEPRAAATLQPLMQQAGSTAGRLPEHVARQLLAGAKETARQALRGDSAGQQQQGQGQRDARSSGDEDAPGRGPQLLPFFLRAAASSLAEWWQQQQERTCPVTKRTLAELTAFRMPNQTNRLAVQFDPYTAPRVPFISGIEVFEKNHRTTPHVHPHAHELFFILAGEGTGFCGSERFPVSAGDVVVFRPGAVHGIDVGAAGRMYCLELMVPNESFAEFVRMGTAGSLAEEDMCVLASVGCR